MAVYTHLGGEALAQLITCYDVGSLLSAKGIAEGVSNSNWLIETTGGRFILTLYERRIDTRELPFFLGLLDHLAEHGCAVPRTIHDRDGNLSRTVANKEAALIEFLPGVSPSQPTPTQAFAVGAALARVHQAGQSFAAKRADRLTPSVNHAILGGYDAAALASIDPVLPLLVGRAADVAAGWPDGLPRSVIHSDLFPDNVLMLEDRVSGLIDFYFACDGMMAYDLAVTHAAWCFDRQGDRFDAAVGAQLVAGYESVRALTEAERRALPQLAQGACLRFVASRAQDWLDTPADALVARKDPMDFVRRWDFYAEQGAKAFA